MESFISTRERRLNCLAFFGKERDSFVAEWLGLFKLWSGASRVGFFKVFLWFCVMNFSLQHLLSILIIAWIYYDLDINLLFYLVITEKNSSISYFLTISFVLSYSRTWKSFRKCHYFFLFTIVSLVLTIMFRIVNFSQH